MLTGPGLTNVDQLLARRAGYPAHYSSKELMEIFGDVLESFTLSSARIA